MELTEVHLREEPGQGRCRLEGNVRFADGSTEVLWFDFPLRLAPLVNRSGDPWVTALAPLAVTLREPLVIGLPADALLVEGIRRAARVWRVWDSSLPALDLRIPMEERAPSPHATRTGSYFSGGVDSWHTVLRNFDETAAGLVPRIDTLLLVWGADIRLDRAAEFQALRERMTSLAGELGCELLDVGSNLRETRWEETDWPKLSHGSFFAAIVHASGTFRRCYIPSSVPYTSNRGWGSHPLTDPMLSTRSTDLIYDSGELNRIAKASRVIESELAMGSLRVCWRSGTDRNCGRCMKCLKTMVALELHGGLTRCTTFPSQRVDPALIRRWLCTEPYDFRQLRNLMEEADRRGRPDLERAIAYSYYRSARLVAIGRLLDRMDRVGIRGATRLRLWLERDAIRP